MANHSTTLQRPLERLQATMACVYAVSLGTDAQRATIARHVNRAHAPVKGPGYSAFDRDLQLWVAATLYRGALDVYHLFEGPVPPADRGSLYRQAWRFGSTLQVEDSQWPPDVAAFDRWWDEQLSQLSVDQQVRDYMHAVLDGRHAPWYLRPAMPLQRFVTRGLLPPALRDVRLRMDRARRAPLGAVPPVGTAAVLDDAALPAARARQVLPRPPRHLRPFHAAHREPAASCPFRPRSGGRHAYPTADRAHPLTHATG